MDESTELLAKPPVGGMDACQNCGHHQWEHNVDILVNGAIVRLATAQRQPGICQHEGSIRCCPAFCRNFTPAA